ncbi:MAG: hypothetical protein M1820_005780 [Bogoriella megaspora]|nr:MAG: hypothetical protein M1820_005780 [Bogoriella megaspora]
MVETAAYRFQAIPELLELMLLKLPLQRILQCQRVCHTWKAAINTSIAIRRALWYEQPTSWDVEAVWGPFEADVSYFHPLVTYLGFRVVAPRTYKHAFTWGISSRRKRGAAPPSPPFEIDPDESREPHSHLYLRHPYSRICINMRKRVDDTPGSWCSMLAVWPPRRYISLILTWRQNLGGSTSYILVSKHEEGIRLGELFAAVAEAQEWQIVGGELRAGTLDHHLYLDPLESPGAVLKHWSISGEIEDHQRVFDMMDAEVDVNAVVWPAWNGRIGPAFSFKRVETGDEVWTPEGANALRMTKRDYHTDYHIPSLVDDAEYYRPLGRFGTYEHRLIEGWKARPTTNDPK